MRFAHLADVHIGAWKDPAMAFLPDTAFEEAIRLSLNRNVDFILIAGDLFDSALPGIDHLRSAVRSLQLAKDADVPVYAIPGSHDFSPSGKSMLGVLEDAGLITNVNKGDIIDGKLHLQMTADEKTGAKLTGILGRKGMLDTKHYEDLSPLTPEGFSIFMFHTSIDELKPKELKQMESNPLTMLPKGFSYYAGGHVHIIDDISLEGYPHVVYPGPLFPANFSELEQLTPSMVIYEDGRIERITINSKKVKSIRLDIEEDLPENITKMMLTAIEEATELKDAIVLMRVRGKIKEGAIGDIDMKRVRNAAQQHGAYLLLRNTAGLVAADMLEHASIEGTAAEIEEKILREHSTAGDENELEMMKRLVILLAQEKLEGETNNSYEERIVSDARKVLKLE